MRGKWLALGVAAVLAGVGGGALSLRYRRPAAPQPVPTSGAAVVANHEITLQGIIRPQHITSVSAPVNGLVETLLADVGQEVYAASKTPKTFLEIDGYCHEEVAVIAPDKYRAALQNFLNGAHNQAR